MAPSEVNEDNADVVRASLYPSKPKTFKWKYDAGDRVRIAMQRQPFQKGYLGQKFQEIFEIVTRLLTTPVTYELHDSRRSYKRSILRAGNSESAKVRRRTLRHRSYHKDEKTRRKDTVPGRVERLSE